MLQNCDWTHMLEDGGLGAVIMAVIWGLWNWYRSRGVPKKSAYEK